ncbi:MAG: PKD domain protein [Lentisphaerae bacterium ADurb.BinA184]|nr:MAG: PKD domain protein [Lentisphaerae bacterium ADurb.BinA184]
MRKLPAPACCAVRAPVAAALLGLVAATLSAAEPWRVPEALQRKALRVEPYPGEARAVSTDLCLPVPTEEGKTPGVVLVDAAGQRRPVRVLSRLGSRLKILFEAAEEESLWAYVVENAPDGEAAAPRSGLLHESRAYNGETVDSLAQFEGLWKTATPQGARFEEAVFAAHNPFGPAAASLHRYDGVLRIETAGEYTFCTASSDASFLLIDGKPVVSWPGRHGPEGGLGGQQRGGVTLAPGPHRFAYLHANCGEPLYAIAAWILPGEKPHEVIPSAAFTPAAYAQVGRLEHREGGESADFTWENQYMATFGTRAVYRLEFQAAAPRDGEAATVEWDFGDGTRGAGLVTTHAYFRPGDYRVTLTLSVAGRPRRLTQAVAVRPRYGQSENDEAAALALLREGVAQEQSGGIQPEGYATLTLGFLFYLQEGAAAEFAPRALAQAAAVPAADIFPLFYRLGRDVQSVGERYDLAEACFRVVLEREAQPELRAQAALHAAGMLIHCQDRPAEARALLETVADAHLVNEWERRLLRIYQADCALVLDGVADARKAYAAVAPHKPLIVGGELDRKALSDYNSRYLRLRNLLAQRLYPEALEELSIIEWETPEEKMSPSLNLLKVEALAGNGQPRKAIVCLERALLAAADDTFRPRLRLKLAELCLANGLLAKARVQAEEIRRESPQSPDEVEARALLAEVERRVQEARP